MSSQMSDYHGLHVLKISIQKGDVGACKQLLTEGLDPNSEGITPLDFALLFEQRAVALLLIRHGAMKSFKFGNTLVIDYTLRLTMANFENVLVVGSARSRIGNISAIRKFPRDLLPQLCSMLTTLY